MQIKEVLPKNSDVNTTLRWASILYNLIDSIYSLGYFSAQKLPSRVLVHKAVFEGVYEHRVKK